MDSNYHLDEMPKTVISTGLSIWCAIAAGLAVGNLYWTQPLLAIIAQDMQVSVASSSFLITATQIGYALGILFIVPLGDILERRRLITLVMLLTALALVACALAFSLESLALALTFLGVVTVSGQIILPMVGDLCDEASRGRIVGIVTSGITLGILFSRFLSGLAAEFWGWRGIYFMAALIDLIMVLILYYKLPKISAKAHDSYAKCIIGVFTSLKRYPSMQSILLKQGCIFGIAFTLFWNALTFLLAMDPFNYGTFQIGLVSLAGGSGALVSVKIGSLQDRGHGRAGILAFILLSFFSLLAAAFSASSIAAIFLVAVFFSVAVQGVGILTQAQLFSLTDSERSRLNTAFVVSNFLFGAFGSFLAFLLWKMGGWQLVMLGAQMASLLALGTHFIENRLQSQN